mgnify:CR=1 FL=1
MKRKGWFLSVALILALVVSGCGSSQNAQSSSPSPSGASSPSASPQAQAAESPKKFGKIRIGYPTQAADMLPLWVGVDHGIFAKYGLDVEPVYMGGSTKVMQGILGRGVEYGLTAASTNASAFVNGQKTVTFGNIVHHSALWIYAQKGFSSVNELKGKTMITASVGTTYESFAIYAIRHHGMVPNKDVKLVNIAGSGDRQAAFLNNSAEAMVTGTPLNYQLDAEGYPMIMDLTPVKLVMGPITTLPDYYEANMEQNVAVVKAFAESIKFIKTERDKTIDTLAKWTNVPRQDAEKAYETVIAIDVYPDIPRIDEQDFMFPLENGSDEKLHALTIEDTKAMYTNEIVDRLEAEGFFKS